MTGSGHNSKTMIVKLIEIAFGPYCVKMPNGSIIVTKNQGGSNATPDLVRMKGARVMFYEELKNTDVIDDGKFKKASGNDSTFVRGLYSNGETIPMTAHPVFVCNDPPIFSNSDPAVEDRTKMLPFLSKWVDNPEEKDERERPFFHKKDPFFDRLIPSMSPAFLWLLVGHFPYYIANGLKVPPIVIQRTEQYWAENDIYRQFSAANVEIVRLGNGEADMKSSVTLTALYTRFVQWFRNVAPDSKPSKRSVFIQEIKRRWGPCDDIKYPGIRMKFVADGDSSSRGGGRGEYKR